MTQHLFPIPRPASGRDERFTFSLVLDVADVLAAHGYPDIGEAFAGHDFVALRGVLFGFIYGSGTAGQASVSVVDDAPRIVPCGFGCGYLADSEADLDHHENDECEHRFAPDLPADAVRAPRPVGSIPRRVLRPHPHPGGDLR